MSKITKSDTKPSLKKLFLLSLGALGVVYGDIGTSPLYSINELFFGRSLTHPSQETILGGISIVFWALTIIVSFKYIVYVLRADNEGEGGVFALYGLLAKKNIRTMTFLASILILAAGLLIGDGIITPAISVISAVEGLKLITSSLEQYIVPITIVILTALFAIQNKGTHIIGKLFGPVIIVWFASIASFGLIQIVQHPYIFMALNPYHAFHYLITSDLLTVMFVLGSVMLVVTGGEAMYADMGHFGKLPIRISWFSIVYPSLILNYFGQGAYLLSNKPVIDGNIFYSMIPQIVLAPMVVLATCATIIASQALISGAYSLIAQAITLGLLPRLKINHTHEEHTGQIYVPFINWILYIGCVILVFAFQSSTRLAGAYGLAVSGVMFITSINMIAVARYHWHWNKYVATALFLPLSMIDLLFFSANTIKLFEGGLIPLSIGLLFLLIIQSWMWGRKKITKAFNSYPSMTIKELLDLRSTVRTFFEKPVVIMTPTPITELKNQVPLVKKMFWDKYEIFPRHLIFLHVKTSSKPHIHDHRYHIQHFYNDAEKGSVTSVEMRFGFMEKQNVESMLDSLAHKHLVHLDTHHTEWIIHVVHERPISSKKVKTLFQKIRRGIFMLLSRNSQTADQFFGLGNEVQLTIDVLPVKI